MNWCRFTWYGYVMSEPARRASGRHPDRLVDIVATVQSRNGTAASYDRVIQVARTKYGLDRAMVTCRVESLLEEGELVRVDGDHLALA